MIEVEKQYKEKLTPERIAEDLDFSVPHDLLFIFFLLAVFSAIMALAFYAFSLLLPDVFPFGRSFRIFLFVVVAFYCFSAIEMILCHRVIREKKFLVEIDQLVEKCKYPWHFLYWHRDNPSRLTFSRFGKYSIWRMEYYPWSKNFVMHQSTLFSASDIGEDFIVVLYPYTKKIAMIYSTRVFTYSPES